jgi:membrane protein
VRETWKKVNENEILTRASAIAFYAMLAFVPFLALFITLAVQLLPDLSDASGHRMGVGNLTVDHLRELLRGLFPEDASQVIADQIVRLQKQPRVDLLSMGLAISLWSASSLFLAVIDAMNRINELRETRPFWKLRLTGLVVTIIQAAILMGSLLIVVAWPHLIRLLGLGQATALLAGVGQLAIVFVMVLASFALAFYIGPATNQRWEWITPGSLGGTIVFLVTSYLFRVAIQDFTQYDRTYGSLAGVMVLLLWFWISSVVLLTAGQVNKVIEDAALRGQPHSRSPEPTPCGNDSPAPPDGRDAPARQGLGTGG